MIQRIFWRPSALKVEFTQVNLEFLESGFPEMKQGMEGLQSQLQVVGSQPTGIVWLDPEKVICTMLEIIWSG